METASTSFTWPGIEPRSPKPLPIHVELTAQIIPVSLLSFIPITHNSWFFSTAPIFSTEVVYISYYLSVKTGGFTWRTPDEIVAYELNSYHDTVNDGYLRPYLLGKFRQWCHSMRRNSFSDRTLKSLNCRDWWKLHFMAIQAQ